MKYYYDRAIHTSKTSTDSVWMIRIIGFSFLIVSLIEIFQSDYKPTLWNTLFIVVMITGGILQLLFPKLILRPSRKVGRHFVKMDNERIQWKLGKSGGLIQMNEVEKLEQNVGEIIFIMKNSEKSIFPSYEIENKEKFDEIRSILLEK